MQDIPFGQLLVLIAFILLPLLNLLLQRMRRIERQTPADKPPRQVTPRLRTMPASPEIIAFPKERIRAAELAEALPPRRRQSRTKSLLRNRRDLRRAIILMAVLGPCRANDPSD